MLGGSSLIPASERIAVSTISIPVAVKTVPSPQTSEELYLDLLKKVLTRAQVSMVYERHSLKTEGSVSLLVNAGVQRLLFLKNLELVRRMPSQPRYYQEGGPSNQFRLEDAETMIGTKQLDNMQFCITDVLSRKVDGDMIETGAWRGGMTIFMRAVLKTYGDNSRKVWVADSFEGLPTPDPEKNISLWRAGDMAVSLNEVRDNFARYGLLDDKVRFLKGFFSKTLPDAPITKLAILRSDADLYESTMDVLNNLYPKLSVGGYAIFDDYLCLPDCKRAIDDYRKAHNITEEIKPIDSQAVYWMKQQ